MNWLIRKDLDAGKDWRQEERGTTEDEMVGWHHQLNGYEFEQALGIGGGQGSLVCCSPWGRKESDMTKGLNWTECDKDNQVESNFRGQRATQKAHYISGLAQSCTFEDTYQYL